MSEHMADEMSQFMRDRMSEYMPDRRLELNVRQYARIYVR
jgi:hypothetical protein